MENYHTISITIKSAPLAHRIGGNLKPSEQAMNVDHKSLEPVFSIVICRQLGNKWQSIIIFLTIFDLRSSIVKTISIAAYPVCLFDTKTIRNRV